MKTKGILLITGLFFILASCHHEVEAPLQSGTLLNSAEITTYDTVFIRQIIHAVGDIGNIPLQYNVSAVKIFYLTPDPDGSVVTVSGLLLVPVSEGSFPVMSIQHGTIIKRSEVSSENPLLNEGVVGLIAAADGYVTCIPDYLGLGVSNEMHPYLIGSVLAGNVADMIRATKSYMEMHNQTANGQLYLAGYSEGGYVTMATHRALETGTAPEGMQVTASAPMAGPYDLKTTIDTILSYGTYKSPAYIAYFLTAYDKIYGWNRLHDIFREPYASMIPDLFDGLHSTGDINKALPKEIDSLLNADFLHSYLSGNDPELLKALQANTLLGWGLKAPVHLYHGNQDHTVPYWNAVNALEDLRQQGATQVELITVPGGDHGSSVVPSFTGALHWFDSLRAIMNN
ncbi:MAG: prolyl oligopeptidase family serine peptidase [Bacteroidales bacterium]|nr:prolyl oligopeptidase family serine peptidase [Bacteroidales bacterium]